MEKEKDPNPRLGLREWIFITGAIVTMLGGIATTTGHSMFVSGASPDITELKSQVSRQYEEGVQMRLTIERLQGRVAELEHRQGYYSGDNGYFHPRSDKQ